MVSCTLCVFLFFSCSFFPLLFLTHKLIITPALYLINCSLSKYRLLLCHASPYLICCNIFKFRFLFAEFASCYCSILISSIQKNKLLIFSNDFTKYANSHRKKKKKKTENKQKKTIKLTSTKTNRQIKVGKIRIICYYILWSNKTAISAWP